MPVDSSCGNWPVRSARWKPLPSWVGGKRNWKEPYHSPRKRPHLSNGCCRTGNCPQGGCWRFSPRGEEAAGSGWRCIWRSVVVLLLYSSTSTTNCIPRLSPVWDSISREPSSFGQSRCRREHGRSNKRCAVRGWGRSGVEIRSGTTGSFADCNWRPKREAGWDWCRVPQRRANSRRGPRPAGW